MTRALRRIDVVAARRLALHAQRLEGSPPRSTAANVLDVLRSIRCVQLDPISVVARSPLLVLHSRLAGFRPEHLERQLWLERSLFEYWAHAASVVLTEDLPIHAWYMRRLARDRRASEWMRANASMRRSILTRLRREGPLPSRLLSAPASTAWRSSGWSDDRNVDRMLSLLWGRGRILVAGRQGQQKLWDLAERVLPPDASRGRLSDLGVTRAAADVSLRGLGVGTPGQIRANFTRRRYPRLAEVLAGLERSGRAERVEVASGGERLPGDWYLHREHAEALERIEAGRWRPRVTMLSPFDNLIADRQRAQVLFGLDYRMEIYVPRGRRRFGYYAMPVLHGDRFVARVDPSFDRVTGRLRLNAVHPEPGHRGSAAVGEAVGLAVRELAAFLGAGAIEPGGSIPGAWRSALG